MLRMIYEPKLPLIDHDLKQMEPEDPLGVDLLVTENLNSVAEKENTEQHIDKLNDEKQVSGNRNQNK